MRQRTTRSTLRLGNVAVMVALLLTALLGMVGFAVDGGALLSEKRHAQTTADAAAMAAACYIYENFPAVLVLDELTQKKKFNFDNSFKAGAQQAALEIAAANGYANDGNDSTKESGTSMIQVRFPGNFLKSNSIYNNTTADSPSFEGKLAEGCVEVTVTYYHPRYFSSIWGLDAMPIKCRAVAKGAWRSPKLGIIVLDYDPLKGSLSDKGGGTLSVAGGPFIVNSSHPDAAVMITGGGSIVAPEFNVTGGVNLSGAGSSITTSPIAGQVFSGIHPTPDPLAYLPTPEQPPNQTALMIGTTAVLVPGRYTSLPSNNVSQIIFDGDGVYWFDTSFVYNGVAMSMSAGTSGVLFYQNSGTFNISGNAAASVNLHGITGNSPYEDLIFWQPKHNTNDVGVTGNGGVSIEGTFYAPNALLTLTGNGGGATGTQFGSQFVTHHFKVAGNGDINVKYSGPDAAKTRILCLVE